MQKFENELAVFFAKLSLLLPAFIAVSIKIAITVRKRKFNLINAIVSLISGVGMAWIVSPYFQEHLSPNKYPIAIALIAISADKFFEWLLIKLDDYSIFDLMFEPIKRYFKKK